MDTKRKKGETVQMTLDAANAKSEKMQSKLMDLSGVGEKTVKSLLKAGYDSPEKIAKSSVGTLAKKVDGVGKGTAETIIAAAKKMVKAPTTKTSRRKTTKGVKKKPQSAISMTKLPGVGAKTRESLIAAGYDSVEKISSSKPSEIAKGVEGVGKSTAEKIVRAAKKMSKPPKKKSKPKKKSRTEQPTKSDALETSMTSLPGVGAKTRDSLIAAGYDSVEKISRSKASVIAKNIDGVGTKTAEAIVKAAKEILPPEEPESPDISMKDLPGVGPKTRDALVDAGYSSIAKISETKPTEIAKAVDGVGKTTAGKIVKAAQELVGSEQESVEEPKPSMRPVRPLKKVPERERAKPVKKKSGLPVPETVIQLEKEMKENWAEAQKKIDQREVQKTMKVSALTADETEERLVKEVEMILNEIVTTGRPAFEIPSRSSDNIVWDEVRDLLLLGMKKISRPYHSLGSVVDATRTARLMEIVFQLLQSNLHATKREVFYSDVNLFRDQKYSDRIMEDVASMLQTTRDSIHIVASARGSAMGRVVIRDGGDLIDLTKMGTGGWAITPFLDQVDIVESDAEFIIMSEKDAAVMRLAEAKYWNRQPCIVLTGKGSGDIATRAFLKRLVRELEIPAFALVDSDPYGHYIYSVFLRGSKRLSYESPFIATPELKLLGVLSRDLDAYNIPKAVRIPMEPTDMKRVKDMLKEDFVQSNKEWVEDLRLMLRLKEKAEIQAFASHSFEFLTDEYLPTKLETGDWI